MTDATVMVRARASTRDILKEMAQKEGVTLIEVLERVVERAREEQMLAAVVSTLDNHAHAVIQEAAAFDDVAAEDGLDADDDFSDW